MRWRPGELPNSAAGDGFSMGSSNYLGGALFAVGAARTFVTRRGLLRSGVELLLVGALAAVVAFSTGAFAAVFA